MAAPDRTSVDVPVRDDGRGADAHAGGRPASRAAPSPQHGAPTHGRTPAEDASTAELVGRVARWMHGRAREGLAPLGLTPAAGRAFVVIARCEPVRMAELAGHLRVVPRSATTTVDLLEEAGLVERAQDPGDRRSVLVRLSGAGRTRLAALGAARDAAAGELLTVLSPAEQRTLHDLLARVDDAAHAASCAPPDAG